jgi:Tfp pilus assembly protein PilX
MKAAKDGQDGADCIQLHPGCSSSSAQNNVHPPMIKTYHDINKLVQARKLGKSIGFQGNSGSSTEPQLPQVN